MSSLRQHLLTTTQICIWQFWSSWRICGSVFRVTVWVSSLHATVLLLFRQPHSNSAKPAFCEGCNLAVTWKIMDSMCKIHTSLYYKPVVCTVSCGGELKFLSSDQAVIDPRPAKYNFKCHERSFWVTGMQVNLQLARTMPRVSLQCSGRPSSWQFLLPLFKNPTLPFALMGVTFPPLRCLTLSEKSWVCHWLCKVYNISCHDRDGVRIF